MAGRCGPPRRSRSEPAEANAPPSSTIRSGPWPLPSSVGHVHALSVHSQYSCAREGGGGANVAAGTRGRARAHLPPSPFPHAPRASRPSTQRRRRSWRRPRRPRRGPAWRRCCSCGRRANGRMRGGGSGKKKSRRAQLARRMRAAPRAATHLHQRMSPPSALSVSMSTAVWMVMCSEPAVGSGREEGERARASSGAHALRAGGRGAKPPPTPTHRQCARP